MFRFLLQAWLHRAAREKLAEIVADAIRPPSDDQTVGCSNPTARSATNGAAADPAKPSITESQDSSAGQALHAACIFALGNESGGFEDLCDCSGAAVRADGFCMRLGTIRGRRVAVVISGAGRQKAAHAAAAVIEAHRPKLVISAGFGGALRDDLRRNDIVVANSVVQENGEELPLESADDLRWPRCLIGRMRTVDRVVRTVQEKRQLRAATGADLVEMETAAVVETCRRLGVPAAAIRVVIDTADEELPPHLEVIVRQQSKARQWGAALGAIFARPKSVGELYQLKENALLASDRLAKFLAEFIARHAAG